MPRSPALKSIGLGGNEIGSSNGVDQGIYANKSAGLGELHIDAELMAPQPTLFDNIGEASTIFGGEAPSRKRNGP